MEIKISFDFDRTLDREDVQEYCKHLQSKDIEIYITTSRAEVSLFGDTNSDMFEVCDLLNIPKENIIFCNYYDKYEIIKDFGFLWHLDDNEDELTLLKLYTDIKAIDVTKNDWRELCDMYLSFLK